MYHITPKEYIYNIDSSCCDIIFLGYTNISIDKKFEQIRQFDSIYDWTRQREDSIVK